MPGTFDIVKTLDPRRRPRQARSRQTCADILTAAADVLRKDGASAFNTNSIAERAGVSVGSLYQYYPTVGDGREARTFAAIAILPRGAVGP